MLWGETITGGISMNEETSSNSNPFFAIIVIALVLALIVGVFFFMDIRKNEKVNIVTEKFPDYDSIDLETQPIGYDYYLQPMIGDKNAPIRLVEFGDYKCPPCAQWNNEVYPQLYEDYIKTGKVKMYFINYQFLGPDSLLAGTAGEIIYKQNPDAFWQFHKAMYEHQPPKDTIWATQDYLVDFVEENVDGIDVEQFAKDLKEFKYFEEVKVDYEDAKHLSVESTPTIHIDGEKIDSSYTHIKNYIDVRYEEFLADLRE